MASNEDFKKLAVDLRSLSSVPERVSYLLDLIRHELDLARSQGEWDNVSGLSQLLGGHAEHLSTAVAVDRPDEPTAPEKPVRRSRADAT